ncbi:hypothetical protein LQZ19_00590 [Treponema primitia]|uniref:hypothetical protein n=1 Tax=Treponema primitia TaxID=88058 RepID=UPI00398160D2
MRFTNPTEKHRFKTRKERRILSDFLTEETIMAKAVMNMFRQKHIHLPDDVYRGLAYFINEEWAAKAGSLFFLYETKRRVQANMPPVTKETALDQMCYFFKMYCAVQARKDFNGLRYKFCSAYRRRIP